jgi:hypothetical protein
LKSNKKNAANFGVLFSLSLVLAFVFAQFTQEETAAVIAIAATVLAVYVFNRFAPAK